MKLRVTAADPAGNVTLLVESPVPQADYFSVASRLLRIPALGGEQVGFLTQPKLGGAVRLEMMGGEFCGNAARCAGLYRAVKQGVYGNIPVEISGCGGILTVETGENSAWADMPLPVSMEQVYLDGVPFDAVCFEGIVHLVAEHAPLAQERVRELLPAAAKQFGLPAAGMMFLRDGFMIPAVYVRDTDTLFWENSCASGSAAAAWRDAVRRDDGEHRLRLRQPGGVIETAVTKMEGAVTAVRIGGPAVIHAAVEVEL